MTFEFNRKTTDHFTDSPAIGVAYRIRNTHATHRANIHQGQAFRNAHDQGVR